MAQGEGRRAFFINSPFEGGQGDVQPQSAGLRTQGAGFMKDKRQKTKDKREKL